MLFIFSGLPGTGKSVLSRYLSEEIGAVYLRIDTIEQELKRNGFQDIGGTGYGIAYKIARDNLRSGLSVVGDSVNPLKITREAWRNVAIEEGCKFCELEIICSDKKEHKNRIESRSGDIERLRLPSWQDVLDRNYDTWTSDRIVIDTANKKENESKEELILSLKDVAAI